MKIEIAKGHKEDGVIIGNNFDKYGSSNPLVKLIMNEFDRALGRLVHKVNPKDIHEIGCGEGYWIIKWHKKGFRTRGSDFSTQVINLAKGNAMNSHVPTDLFSVKSIYNLQKEVDSADLIVCCEVMEHLENPDLALQSLQRITGNYLILSVPREPIWRVLNVMRAKYITDWGNTPGHIQHWNKREIVKLVKRYFKIIEVVAPFPWTMILCKRVD